MSTTRSADPRSALSTLSRTALLGLSSWLALACVIDTRSDQGTSREATNSAGTGGASAAGGGATSSGGLAGAPSGGSAGQAGTPSGGAAGQAGTPSGGAAAGGASGASGSSSGGGGSGGGTSVSSVPRIGGALKIMPFGDSITASTCYRARLAELLDAEHAGDYDFVGNENGDKGCGYTYDMAHEGHGGFLITQHTGDVAGWASANPADVVLLHFATNDVWNNVSVDSILTAYGQAVDEFRKSNPKVTILAAQLIPFAPDGCGHCNVEPLNAALPNWAATKGTAESPIIVVDQWSGYNPSTDADDKVHPNDSGSAKMAGNWAEALDPLF